jgi:hypothetical protein
MSTVDLPPIHGSVDVYPWASNLILARGLQYDPRPVFQSYSAYTPELAKMNADFLKGPRAPDTALINVESIEHRFAPQDDAASWPELLTGYDLIWASPSILVLQRSPQPRTFSLEPVKVLTVPMGTPVDVPQIADPVWVSVRVDLTPSGRITAALYRPPMIGMLVMPTSGGSVPFRLVPQTAREGFLLSPAVLRPRLFALLASTQWQQSMQNFMIRQIAVGGFDGADPQGLYEPNCTILFSALKFEHHDLSQVPGMSQFLAPQP